MGSTYLRQRMKTLCLFLGLSLTILTFLNQETEALSFNSNGILFRDSRETKRIINSAIKRNEKNSKKKQKKNENKKVTKSRNRKKKTKREKEDQNIKRKNKTKTKAKTKRKQNLEIERKRPKISMTKTEKENVKQKIVRINSKK